MHQLLHRIGKIILPCAGILILAAAPWARPADPVALRGVPVKATFLSNCGFLLQLGDQKVLIDVETRRKPVHWPGLLQVHQKMRLNQPPFDGISLILISHPHADHLAPAEVLAYLAKNPRTRLCSTPDTLAELKKADPAGVEPVRNQILVVDPYQENPLTRDFDGLQVDFIGTWHAGAPQYELKDLCFGLRYQGTTICYLSDIDPGYGKNLPVLQQWKARQGKVDLLFAPDASLYVNEWSSAAGVAFIKSLQPGHTVAMHVKPKDIESALLKVQADFPKAVFFRNSLESMTFE